MKKNPIALCIAAALVTAPAFAETPEETLLKRVDALSQQLDAVKAELAKLKAQNDALAARQAEPPAAATTAAAATPVEANAGASGTVSEHAGVVSALPALLSRATLFGYGQIGYNRYTHDDSRTQADLTRAVFGIGYRFNDSTRFVSEFEVEHAIASADDAGEFEVEQFYIDHQVTPWAAVKVGLILIPSGYINEVHEPPRFYGVERNFVESAIIPTTLREGGVGVHGNVLEGLEYDFGLTTSPNLSNWDFSSTEGQESPLGSVHQELQLASVADFSEYGALNYNGLPGFNIGASFIEGGVGQHQPDSPVNGARYLLTEAHTRWRPGRFDLEALYARGSFSKTRAANLANAGSLTPIPKAFHGWLVQGAYKLWEHGIYAFNPFVRYERFNTGDYYAEQPAGFETPGRT